MNLIRPTTINLPHWRERKIISDTCVYQFVCFLPQIESAATMDSSAPSLRPTWSQPLLSLTGSASISKGDEESNLSPVRKSRLSESGTMYRPDVFYQGSLENIPRFRSRGELSISGMDRAAWQKPVIIEDEEVNYMNYYLSVCPGNIYKLERGEEFSL